MTTDPEPHGDSPTQASDADESEHIGTQRVSLDALLDDETPEDEHVGTQQVSLADLMGDDDDDDGGPADGDDYQTIGNEDADTDPQGDAPTQATELPGADAQTDRVFATRPPVADDAPVGSGRQTPTPRTQPSRSGPRTAARQRAGRDAEDRRHRA